MSNCEELQTPLSNDQLRSIPVVALAKASPLFFMDRVLGMKIGWHHKEWVQHVDSGTPRLVILCARNHGKSYFFSLTYPLWRSFSAKKPLAICIASYSQSQATELVTKIKRTIEQNPYLRPLIRENPDTWGKTALYLANGVHIVSESFGSSVRGGHFDLLIVDDPVKDFGGMSREEQINFFEGVFVPTINPDGQIVVVGTPIDKRDLIYHLEQNFAYKTFRYPAIVNNQALWPERFSLEKLNQIKVEMGSAKFNREYLLEIIDSETAIFKEEWIKTTTQIPEGLKVYAGVDLAIGQRPDSDYFAVVVVGADKNKNLYVLHASHGHYTLQKQMDRIVEINKQFHPIKIAIESNAYQAALPDQLIATTGVPVRKVISQQDKVTRAERLAIHFENQKILIREGLNELIEELIFFRRHKHDDLVDALGFSVQEAAKPCGEAQVFII